MNFHSICPNLESQLGHQYIYHHSIGSSLIKNKHHFSCWANKKFNDSTSIPFFFTPYFTGKSTFLFLFELLTLTRKTKKLKDKTNYFLLESFNIKQLLVFYFFSIFIKKKTSYFCVILRYGLSQLKFNGLLHTVIFHLFQLSHKEKFSLCTDSNLIRDDITCNSSLKTKLVPVPILPDISINLKIERKKILSLWWPGEPRVSKGLNDIKTILSLSNPTQHKLEIVISNDLQINNTCDFNIKRIKSTLLMHEYNYLVQYCDIFLLPYDPNSYKYGTSGIFIECICAGKIPIVKSGSWLAKQLELFNLNELIFDWKSQDFFENVFYISQNEAVKFKLQIMKKNFINTHTPENFIKTIIPNKYNQIYRAT